MTEKNQQPHVLTSKVEGRVLIIERIFQAPRSLVFQMFSESKHLEEWWGPEGWKTTNYTFDFKPGGEWHFRMKCVDEKQGDYYGQESWGKVIFHEIKASEEIVYTDTFSDEDGKAVPGMPEIHVTIQFKEQDGATVVKTSSTFEAEDALKRILDMGVVQGFSSQCDCLDEYLEKLQ